MKKDALALLTLAVLTLGFFHPLIFLDQLPSFRDIYLFAYPMKVFAAFSLKQGLIPLWDSYSGLGMPFYANLQSEVFYPPNFLFYLLPTKTALKLFITLHFFLGGWFTYLFARELSLSRISALVSAFVFTFGGSLISLIDTTSALCATVWLPLVLLFSHRMLKSFEPRWVLLTGSVLAVQFLAGFPEVFILTFFLIGFMAFLEELGKTNRQDAEDAILRRGGWGTRGYGDYFLVVPASLPPRVPMSNSWRLGGSLFFVSVITLGLIMFQLLPFLEFIGLSTRSEGLTYETATQGSLHPGHLVKLLVPGFYGNPMEVRPTPIPEGWLKGIYIGLLPLILAILGAWVSHPLKALLTSVSLLMILLSLGDHFVLYRVLFPLGLHTFRFPSKFFILAAFTLSILSGYGLDGIKTLARRCRDLTDKVSARRRQLVTTFLIILAGLGALCVLVWAKFGYQLMVKPYLLSDGFKPEWAQTFFSRSLAPSFQSLAILFISIGILLLVLHHRLPLTLFKGLVVILIALDLFIHNFTLMPVVSSHAFEFPTRTITFLKAELDPVQRPFRVYSTPLTWQGAQFLLASGKYGEEAILTATDLLLPNVGLTFQIPNAMTKGSVELASYEVYRNRLESLLKLGLNDLLDRFNVKYVISTFPLDAHEFRLIKEGPIKIFQNKTFLPRAYRVPSKELFDLPEQTASSKRLALSEISFDQVTPLKIEHLTPHHIRVGAGLKPAPPEEGGSWLVLSDQYYPGWQAYGDGQEIAIQEVDNLFMGVELPPGIHQVEFKYRPSSFKIGLFISLWTILVIIGYILCLRSLGFTPAAIDNK